MDNGIITFDGTAVKALGEGKVAGHVILFSTEHDPDLTNEFFDLNTDFDFEDGTKTSIMYNHGLDKTIGKRVIGKGVLSHTEHGIWVEAQLNMRDEYERSLYDLAEKGKLGWSSGSAGHRMEKQPAGKSTWIKAWPIVEASLTPTPAEPRTRAIPLKALDPTEGKTLADHTAQILADLSTYSDRIESFVSLKCQEDRTVSKVRQESFRQVHQALGEVVAKCNPGPDPALRALKIRAMKEKYGK